MAHLLDDPAWHSLNGAHRGLGAAVGSARRYRPDVSPFGAIERDDAESWASLEKLVGPGGRALLVRRQRLDPPTGWSVSRRARGSQMVLAVPLPPADPDLALPLPVRRLTIADVPRMRALVAIAQPGPFEPSTIEMGNYLGAFDGEELLAMAGERMHPPGHTEISAVCTHPAARGQGLGAALTTAVARGVVARGETPFLHVADGNDAKRLYERLGFTVRAAMEFVMVEPSS